MKTKIQTKEGGNSELHKTSGGIIQRSILPLLLFLVMTMANIPAFAHCDTMDGPLIADARQAIAQNNVNYVLKWVPAENEPEIRAAFDLMMKVRAYGPETKDLSEKYFFDTLVRIHRDGEGVPFTGVKPSGTPIDEKILAADKAIETGNLSPLEDKIPEDKLPELASRFAKVMSLKNFNVNDVEAGRKYIEAYVQFFKFAEGEDEAHHSEHAGHDAR